VVRDKVVLISGSTGIAGATARSAARQGARLFVIDRNPGELKALAEAISAEGSEASTLVGDLTTPETAALAVKTCVDRFGRVDALFNVAGGSGRKWGDGPLHACTDEGWDATLSMNLTTMFRMCRAALQAMLSQPLAANGLRGTILNMGSVLASSPQGQHFATHAYAAAKSAIEGMSRAMAAYYAPQKIRVNVIAPGLVHTPMSRRAQEDPDIVEMMKRKQPLCEGLMDATDVAETALFLMGDATRMMTGVVVPVDAGWKVSE
jgi:NAD(P)-dependent dehydrogenase (short-subunit alcohol dehydrogenase family)